MQNDQALLVPDQAPFRIELFARWADIDFNQHMRNAAFLGAAEDCRMRFLEERGFTMKTFAKLQLGPVVLEDRLRYRGEVHPLQTFEVELWMAAITKDGRRMKVQNRIVREGKELAVVESVVLWLDLVARKATVPPDALRDAWMSLARTDDFDWLD